MKNLCTTCFGVMLAVVAASPNCWAVVYQFDASVDNAFLTPNNWSILPGMTPNPGVPDDPTDRAIINNNLTATYATAVTTTVGSLVVGADWPVTGETGTDGTLNMTAGKFIVTSSIEIARARGPVFGDGDGDGVLTMTNAEIEFGSFDAVVGQRDHGVLDIGTNAKVYNTPGQDNYWRLGNYGPSVDAGLEGNGLLNVHSNGTFNGHVIFIGDNDATGELRISDTGSVVLTGNLVPRPSGFQAGGSAKVVLNGSNVTLSAYNLESESLAGEIPTQYVFNADAGGVSEIFLRDAINITNNSLVVDLTSYAMAPSTSLLLFDGDHTGAADAPIGNRIFGTFANLSVLGGVGAGNYFVEYNQANGNISLQRTVPEPSTMMLLALGMSFVFCAKRRASR
jgi:hypothetical protein